MWHLLASRPKSTISTTVRMHRKRTDRDILDQCCWNLFLNTSHLKADLLIWPRTFPCGLGPSFVTSNLPIWHRTFPCDLDPSQEASIIPILSRSLPSSRLLPVCTLTFPFRSEPFPFLPTSFTRGLSPSHLVCVILIWPHSVSYGLNPSMAFPTCVFHPIWPDSFPCSLAFSRLVLTHRAIYLSNT